MSLTSARRSGPLRLLLAVAAAISATSIAACGGDGDGGGSNADLAPVESYLAERAAVLQTSVSELERLAAEYDGLAQKHDYDYDRLLEEDGAEAQGILTESKREQARANNSYQEIKGLVAGIPDLSEYDHDIDSGTDAICNPARAVSFSLSLPDGTTLKQPGNLLFITETALDGSYRDFQAKDVQSPVAGLGVPDGPAYLAATEEFARQADALNEDIDQLDLSASDVFSALATTTPDLRTHFDEWKATRFGGANLRAVAEARLQGITGLVNSLVLTYRQVEPLVAEVSPEQAERLTRSYADLQRFVEDLAALEARGETITPADADAFGSEAQRRGTAIAAQLAAVASELGIELEEPPVSPPSADAPPPA